MKRTLKYGLTTALRSFEEPEEWRGHEDIRVVGADILSDVISPQGRVLSLMVTKETKLNIERIVHGNCRTTIAILVTQGVNTIVTETISGSGTLNSQTMVAVMSNAQVTYTIVQEMSEESIALLRYESTLNHSTIKWLFVGLGADTTQAFISTNAGEHSEVINNAVLYGAGTQQFDIHVATNHAGPNSKSDMLTRSVLDGKARAVYHGLIHIGPDSPECDSYQKDEVILLSDTAGADAIPNLEIQNNKVRCTHGASIGKLDAEKLFYLKTRGISEVRAKRMITEGFLFSILPQELHEKITLKAGGSDE